MGFPPFDWCMRLATYVRNGSLGVGTWKNKKGRR